MFCFFIFGRPRQRSSRGWNDNKWEPLEELLAIKGNREPQYTTPVILTKLKQITSTSIAYYAANEDGLFIIINPNSFIWSLLACDFHDLHYIISCP